MPYCAQCGAEVDKKEKFCAECGAPVVAEGKTPAAAKAKTMAAKASSKGEVIESRGGVSYEEPSKATPAQEASGKKAKTKMALPKVNRKIMLLAGVAVIAVAVVGAYLLMGVGQAGVPVYPGATENTIQGMTLEDILSASGESLPSGWTAKMYQTAASSGAITNWYRNNMPGWTKAYDNTMTLTESFGMDILGFTNESKGSFVIIMYIVEEHYIITMLGPVEDMQNLWSGNF
jgi:hypothetical protein